MSVPEELYDLLPELLRNYKNRRATPDMEVFTNPYDNGYVKDWLVCIILENKHDPKWSAKPIVEFYSLDTNQFVSSYYIDTFLGRDEYGHGYGSNVDLWGDVPSWKITAELADEVREWIEAIGY